MKKLWLFLLGALVIVLTGVMLFVLILGPETSLIITGSPVASERQSRTPADDLRRHSDSGEAELVFTLHRAEDKVRVAALLTGKGGTVLRGLEEEGRVLRVRLPVPLLDTLEGHPDILFIEPYEAPGFLNDRVRAVTGAGFLAVPGLVTSGGLTGAGEIVGIADSGLDRGRLDQMHPDLANVPGRTPKVQLLQSWSGGGTADPIGHGTHIAATVAGTGAASHGRYRGVAPGAGIYFQALLNRQGELEPPADLFSLFLPAYEAGVRVHINGWGGQTNTYRSASAQIDHFTRLYPDFLPVFGAGNTGPGEGTLTPEANSKNALVVGASQNPRPAYGPESRDVHKPATFSSRGPAADGRIKPDLLAPGTAVISARSNLVPGNFPAHPAYTRMQGTSMAAAVGGGAAVLLREYFRKQDGLGQPSAALLRAALINGARPAENSAPGENFGILDLGATVLALREGTFRYADGNDGLSQGTEFSVWYRVTDSRAPFRATLAWTDPAAAPGANRTLVNNLDLVVEAPDGMVHLGNDFTRTGHADVINNVEQVVIHHPQPGTYMVTVRAVRVAENTVTDSPVPVQDFALVYGVPPVREVAAGGSGNELYLSGGSRISMPPGVLRNIVDGLHFGGTGDDVQPGADLYIFRTVADQLRSIYAVSSTWGAKAVKTLNLGGRNLFVKVNPQDRDGGYYLAPQGLATVRLNGEPGYPGDIPPGVEIMATINPSTQTIWRAEVAFRKREGILAAVNATAGEIKLVGDERSLRISATAAVSINDRIVDGCWSDLPFGAATPAQLGQLRPGLAVSLVLSPANGEVQYIDARRLIALGTLRDVDVSGRLIMETGTELNIFPGAVIERNRVPVGPEALQPGDHLLAVLLPGSREVLAVEAYSSLFYGQVLYTGANMVYLIDQHQVLRSVRLTPETIFFRWGLQGDAAALATGHWVRVMLNPMTGAAWRLDISERAVNAAGILEKYDLNRWLVRIDGKSYFFGPRTAVTKNGHPVSAAALRSGDLVEFTALAATLEEEVIFTLAARSDPAVLLPELTVSGLPLENYLLISGRTTADQIYMVRGDGSRVAVPLQEGGFFYPVELASGESGVRVVAVDTRTGGVSGQTVSLPFGYAGTVNFSDIQGLWAEREIRALVTRNLMVGYPDGTFRPSRPVTRAELGAALVRLLGWPTIPGAVPDFTDTDAIPDWARPSIAAAQARNLVRGYPDGTFRAGAPVTRSEAAAVLVRALAEFRDPSHVTPPHYADWRLVPGWAQAAVAQAHGAGVLRGRDEQHFAPDAPLTRAELAVVLNRLLAAGGR